MNIEIDTQKEKLYIILNNLFEKYKNNEAILKKLENYIDENLEKHLDNICLRENKKYINLLENANQREERKQQLIENQEKFINKFLNTNRYLYINSTEIFVYYHNNNFQTQKEDDILHKILTSISQIKELTPWKHKVKISLIKKLKDLSISNVIPDTNTIQSCINILLQEFSYKDECKYFLCIIGDIINKKNDNLTYLINISARGLIKILSDQCYYYFGINLNNFIKFKYHEQLNHKNYRLLNINNTNRDLNNIIKNSLNIFCVGLHYSKRYIDSENFLLGDIKEDISLYSNYLKDNPIENIIQEFIDKNLIANTNNSISQKNMLYLWKLFLDERNLPNLIFQNTLKSYLKNKINFSEENDCYINVFSKSLPLVSKFIEFWDINIVEEIDELGIEIQEIKMLFNLWNKSQNKIATNFILNIIRYYYPDIIIEEDKYILNISCHLWNKREEINKFLEETKNNLFENNEIYPISLDYLYDIFLKDSKKYLSIIKKQYFIKYCGEILSKYMDEDLLINSNWWKD